LERAIEAGAAEVERRAVGEVGEDEIREAIALQRDTLPFFQALAILGNFVVGPLALGARAVCAAVVFAGLAALAGRPIGFGKGLEAAAGAQGFWVAGLAVQTVLAILLGRSEVETSATLLLDPGSHRAVVWVSLRQVDLFALLGWLALARGAWKRGQASMIGAAACVFLLGSAEGLLRIGVELVLGGWMRLSLLPESLG
jgi:hypothetical protein